MTLQNQLNEADKLLAQAGITSSRLDVELLLAYVLKHDRAWILAHADDQAGEEHTKKFNELIQKRAKRTPLVHLIGTREFYGLELEVTKDVLTPRVETEQMVEWAIKDTPKNARLIDIGTGSGAIAIAIAHHRPDLIITATDVSERELRVARANAKSHESKIDFIVSDLWSNVSGQYDTIVTNLPYLENDADLMPEVTREPAVALFGGPDGLGLYRRFLLGIRDHLAAGGHLYTECDPWQHEALIKEAASYGLSPVRQGYFILGFSLPESIPASR